MEMLKQLFDTRMNVFLGDAASASKTTFATKPMDVLDGRVGGTRDGHRDAAGGAWPDPDSASRCHGARWEISYIPYTCVTCRPHVRLHAMEIVTRQVAPHMAGFRAGLHPLDGLSRRYRPDARGSRTVGSPDSTREAAEALRPAGLPGRADRGRAPGNAAARHASRSREPSPPGRPCPASAERTSPVASILGTLDAGRERMSAWKDADAARSPTRPTGLSDTAKAGKPAYPPWPHSVCLPEGLAGGCAPSDPRNGNGTP